MLSSLDHINWQKQPISAKNGYSLSKKLPKWPNVTTFFLLAQPSPTADYYWLTSADRAPNEKPLGACPRGHEGGHFQFSWFGSMLRGGGGTVKQNPWDPGNCHQTAEPEPGSGRASGCAPWKNGTVTNPREQGTRNNGKTHVIGRLSVFTKAISNLSKKNGEKTCKNGW